MAEIKIRDCNLEVAACFRLGLASELEARVRGKNPITLQDAINAAIEAERDLNRRRRLLESPSTDVVSSFTGENFTSGANYVIKGPR